MSVIWCNNNLWLHCVSIGSEYLVVGLWREFVDGLVDGGFRGGMAGAGAEWNGNGWMDRGGWRRESVEQVVEGEEEKEEEEEEDEDEDEDEEKRMGMG